MSDSDKQALLNGTATIQTKLEVHNENLFDLTSISMSTGSATLNNGEISLTWTVGFNLDLQNIVSNLDTTKTYTVSFKHKGNSLFLRNKSVSSDTNILQTENDTDYTSYSLSLTNISGFEFRFVRRNTTGTAYIKDIRIEEGTPTILTEENSVIDWNHEDFRQVKEEGFIGQFVARQLTGNLHNLSDNFKITDKELELKLGVRTNNNTNWYSLGNFLVTKITDNEVNDKTNFEALDYTKKFNKAYEDTITYPCTALQLAQNVCAQCGVALGSSSFKNDDYIIEGNVFTNNESCRDVMKAIGKLAFSWVRVDWDNKVYIDFDANPFRNLFDKESTNWYRTNTSAFIDTGNSSTDRIRTNSFEIEGGKTYTLSGIPNGITLYRIRTYSEYNGSLIESITPTNNTFTLNSNIHYIHLLFSGSNFTNDTNTLMKNANMQLEEEPSTYDTFGNNKYYNLKTQKEVYGPVDKVIIGYSAIDGERTFIGDENGSCEITVYDNPLVFNQTQRASVISAANDLLGMTYTPLNTLTVGHPWLKGNEKVRVTDMENVSHDTIPLDRTIQYFGHIKTLINSSTQTKTNDTLAYKPEMAKNYERSEIYNDQINKQIGIIIESQSNMDSRLNSTISTLDGTIQRVSATETSITDIVTTTQSSIGKNSLYLEDAIEGNVLGYSVDGVCEQDTYSGKNLLPNNLTSQTVSGITLTKNSDGTVLVNGTANALVTVYIIGSNVLSLSPGTYTLSGCPGNGSDSTYRLDINDGATYRDFGSGRTFTLTNTLNITNVRIRIASGTTVNNLLFKPMIEKASSKTDYEQYVDGIESPNPDYPQNVETIPSIINLCGIPDQTFTHCGVEVTIKDGEITLNGTTTSTGTKYISPIKTTTLNGNYVTNYIYISGSKSGSGTSGNFNIRKASDNSVISGTQLGLMSSNSNAKFTISNDTSIIFGIYIQTTGITFNNLKFKPQLVKGIKENYNYVPYGYWSRVKVTGKNLFSGYEVGYINSSNGNDETNNNCHRSFYIPVKPNTTYTTSTLITRFVEYNKNRGFIQCLFNTSNSITTTANTYYLRLGFNDTVSTSDLDVEILEEGNTPTSYEPYKENVVLIDMSKENLFDSSNANTLNAYINASGIIKSDTVAGTLYISCKPNTTYTICKSVQETLANNRFRVGCTSSTPNTEVTLSKYYNLSNGTNITSYVFETDSTAAYLVVNFYGGSSQTEYQNVFNSIKIFESNEPTPYYELCEIEDNKDRLVIDSNGNCVINKKIGKVVLNGSETVNKGGTTSNQYFNSPVLTNYIKPQDNNQNVPHFSTHFVNKSPNQLSGGSVIGSAIRRDNAIGFAFGLDSEINTVALCKTWLSNNKPEFYYQMETPETITLPNTQIPLFEGINHITLIDDLETNTSVVFYRKTPLSDTYATTRQLNDVSVEKTQEIQTVRQEVITEINKESLRIDVVRQEIDETGVPILNTGTGYTFDIDGLKMEKTDQDVKSQLDNDGLSVKYKNEDVLTARSNGVNAVNMTVNKFYIQKPIRMEKTKSISDSTQTGLGFFYIGE